jgi:hypothetical protein
MGIDVVQLTGFDERRDDRPVHTALIRPREQGVFSIQCDRPDRALDGVGVQLDAAVIEEAGEPVPMAEAIADIFGNGGAARDVSQLLLEPGLEVMDEGFAARLPLGAAFILSWRTARIPSRASAPAWASSGWSNPMAGSASKRLACGRWRSAHGPTARSNPSLPTTSIVRPPSAAPKVRQWPTPTSVVRTTTTEQVWPFRS